MQRQPNLLAAKLGSGPCFVNQRGQPLFVGSDLSGQDYAVNMTLMLSCRLKGIDPAAYLTDVLPRIAEAKTSELRDILPDRWQPPAA